VIRPKVHDVMRVLCVHDVVSDQARLPWEVRTVELEAMLTSLMERGYRFCDLDSVPTSDRTVALTVDDAAGGAVAWLLGRCGSLGVRATVFAVVDWLDRPPPRSMNHAYRSLATWADIRRIPDCGHVIGSHGMSHVPMANLADERIIYELHESKRRLEAACESPVAHFAAPYGKLSGSVVSHARAAGYRTISSTVAGINGRDDVESGILKRYVVRSDRPGLGIAEIWGNQ
jgi:peptidoglycan/xylan/chitin deacetylase (PgdA/CDA1 family)